MDNDLVVMPEKYQGKFHNACNKSCDFVCGPCVCGALHHLEDWNDEVQAEVVRIKEEK